MPQAKVRMRKGKACIDLHKVHNRGRWRPEPCKKRCRTGCPSSASTTALLSRPLGIVLEREINKSNSPLAIKHYEKDFQQLWSTTLSTLGSQTRTTMHFHELNVFEKL